MNWLEPNFLTVVIIAFIGLVGAGVAAWKSRSLSPVIDAAEKDLPVVIAAVVADEANAGVVVSTTMLH